MVRVKQPPDGGANAKMPLAEETDVERTGQSNQKAKGWDTHIEVSGSAGIVFFFARVLIGQRQRKQALAFQVERKKASRWPRR